MKPEREWNVVGVDRKSGERVTTTIKAVSRKQARRIAHTFFLYPKVENVKPPQMSADQQKLIREGYRKGRRAVSWIGQLFNRGAS